MGRKCSNRREGQSVVSSFKRGALCPLSLSVSLSVSLPGVCARAKTEDGGFKRCVDHQSRARSSDRRGGVFLSLKSSARARERKEGDAVSDRDVVRATPFAAANETTIGESKTLQKKVRERAPQKQ